MRFEPGVFFLIFLTLCFPSTVACISGPPAQILEHHISVQEFTADIPQSVATVSGVARNMGNWPVGSCTISVIYYNYEGVVLGTFSEKWQLLQPGEIWDFKIEMKGADAWKVARYTITSNCK